MYLFVAIGVYSQHQQQPTEQLAQPDEVKFI
jgi:hypothetical protein